MNGDRAGAPTPGLVPDAMPVPVSVTIPAPPGAPTGSAMVASDSPGSRLLAQAMGNTAVCARLLIIVVVFAAVLIMLALLAPAAVSIVGSILTIAFSGPKAVRAWRASRPHADPGHRVD